MRLLAVGDMHGDLAAVDALTAELRPDVLLCCGDWGDPGQVPRDSYERLIHQTYVLSVFANHDDIELLSQLRNTDGSPVLLANGEARTVSATLPSGLPGESITVAGINGIWAKSHRQPYYITDEEVAAAAGATGHVDVLMTHGCAVGLADLLPGDRHGGQRCFLDAFKQVHPKVYLCGHLHVQQVKHMKDGSVAVNVGNTAEGEYAVIEVRDTEWAVGTGKQQGSSDL